MKHNKISKLLNDSIVSGFVTRKWIEVNVLSVMIYDFNNTFVENAEDLDIVMLMYNLLGYSDNYSMTPRSLRNYYRDEVKECC